MRQLNRRELGRFLRFGSIGLACLVLVQMPAVQIFIWAGVTTFPAIAAGFTLSAVVNFFVQAHFTFGDEAKGNVGLGLIKFLGTSVASLLINGAVVALVLYGLGGSVPAVVSFVRSAGFGLFDTWVMLAAFIGGVAGAAFNFTASRYLRTFGRPSGDEVTMEIAVPVAEIHIQEPEETEVRPHIEHLRWLLGGNSLAVFMPAYKEEGNLPTTVGRLVNYLRTLNLLEFKVVIINDGSPDQTGAVAEKMKAAFPGEVEVIHHEVNQGYGGALITGFGAVVGTGFNLWAFCDSDGQFDPESFGTVLEALFDEDGRKVADLSVGYRIGRRNSDSMWRFYLGRLWHFFGKYVVGKNVDGNSLLSVRDVDCGIKGGFTKSLALIVEQLQGQAAAISPELIARTNMAEQVIVERGVTHLSRLAGESTGDNPKVMLRSGINIIRLGLLFRMERYFGWVQNPAEDVQRTLASEGWKR